MADNRHPELEKLGLQLVHILISVLTISTFAIMLGSPQDFLPCCELLVRGFDDVFRPLSFFLAVFCAEVVIIWSDDSVEAGDESMCVMISHELTTYF